MNIRIKELSWVGQLTKVGPIVWRAVYSLGTTNAKYISKSNTKWNYIFTKNFFLSWYLPFNWLIKMSPDPSCKPNEEMSQLSIFWNAVINVYLAGFHTIMFRPKCTLVDICSPTLLSHNFPSCYRWKRYQHHTDITQAYAKPPLPWASC